MDESAELSIVQILIAIVAQLDPLQGKLFGKIQRNFSHTKRNC